MRSFTINIDGYHVELPYPNVCPHCHVTNVPQSLWQETSQDIEDRIVVLSSWGCSNDSCARVYITSHLYELGLLRFQRYLNGNLKGPDWPKPIIDLRDGKTIGSNEVMPSKFINIYRQSLDAESNGLDEIAGMGYRKAIEYLVKDWAIQCDPGAKDKIESSWLGALINQYFEGELKGILERATWLGNDQAHYKRLFEEYNLEVIKDLISLIMVELERQFKISHYNTVIEKRK